MAEYDANKLKAYTKYLDENDPKENIKQLFDQQITNTDKGMEIASRGPFQNKTPEEQQFEEQNIDPMTRSMLGGGGTAGTLKPIAFPKMQQMFQAGEHVFPANNASHAMQIRDALEAAGKLNTPGATQILKIK